eukprot:scaffold4504_cov96-Skeletonema_marinoi.AAC.1
MIIAIILHEGKVCIKSVAVGFLYAHDICSRMKQPLLDETLSVLPLPLVHGNDDSGSRAGSIGTVVVAASLLLRSSPRSARGRADE